MDLPAVEQYLKGLQASICDELSAIDGSAEFATESWERPEGGGGISRVLADGKVFEKGGVNFSYVEGTQMPGSATQHRPELAGRSFKAMGVSLVMHPRNPYVPTSHANVRCFVAEKPGHDPVWWMGGGFDLTPYYGFLEDTKHWHKTIKSACVPFGEGLYEKYKDQGLIVVGINVDTDPRKVKAFLKQTPLPFDVVLDTDSAIHKQFDATSVPATYWINTKGQIERKTVGYDERKKKELDKYVQSLLKK